jgi:hypothetical protein
MPAYDFDNATIMLLLWQHGFSNRIRRRAFGYRNAGAGIGAINR